MSGETAGDICRKAADLVSGSRDEVHGPMLTVQGKIAYLWQAYLEIRRDPEKPLDALDVTQMMVLLKVARAQCGKLNPDDFIDQVGYGGMSGEIAIQLHHTKIERELSKEISND